MATTVKNYLDDGIVSFAFPKIDTYINDKGEVKKKPIEMPSWKVINKHNCLNHSIGSAYAVICGEQSNLTVVDFDVKEEYHRLMEIHPELKERWTIQTNKGFHIWFKYDSDFKTTTNGFSDYEGVDIRNGGGVVFCAPTTYKYPNGDIKQYVDLGGIFELPPSYLKTYLKQTNLFKKVEPKNKPVSGKGLCQKQDKSNTNEAEPDVVRGKTLLLTNSYT